MNTEISNLEQAEPGQIVEPTEEERKKLVEHRLQAASFAEIVSVLMRSPSHQNIALKELEWFVVPPFMTRQFSLARAKAAEGPFQLFPVGVALWASVSDEVDKRLSENINQPVKLEPKEWNSGENIWLIEIVARQDVGAKMLEDLKKTAFAGKQFKVRVSDGAGGSKIETMSGVAA